MPLLTFTKPSEARRWVPWWAAVLFADHPPRSKKRGARPAPQRYQYEIRRKPVSQHPSTTTTVTQKPPAILRTSQRTRPTNDLFSHSPPLAHKHVHFDDEPPWATATTTSATRNLPKQRFLPDNSQHNRHNAIFGRNTYDTRARDVHEISPVTRHAVAHHEVEARHSPVLSFSHGRPEHHIQPLHPHINGTTRQHCQAHCRSQCDPQDTERGFQGHPSFHEALQRQLEEDLSHTRGPSFHANEGYMHPIAHSYHVHPGELSPYNELPWHMKVGHRAHIHYSHRAMHHHSPMQGRVEAEQCFRSPPVCISYSSPPKTAYNRDPTAERRLSYERTRSAAASHHQPSHHHPLRCHPVDPEHQSAPRTPWNNRLNESSSSPYSSML